MNLIFVRTNQYHHHHKIIGPGCGGLPRAAYIKRARHVHGVVLKPGAGAGDGAKRGEQDRGDPPPTSVCPIISPSFDLYIETHMQRSETLCCLLCLCLCVSLSFCAPACCVDVSPFLSLSVSLSLSLIKSSLLGLSLLSLPHSPPPSPPAHLFLHLLEACSLV